MKLLHNLFLTSNIINKNINSISKITKINNNIVDSLDTTLLINSVNAWSVNGNDLNATDLAANLFASSLLPYLVLLYFLSNKVTNTPKLGNFGFQFLLVFVFATIPAGIFAKINYNDILANVDLYHFGAESFLTITNLLIISGFRQPRTAITDSGSGKSSLKPFSDSLILLPIVLGILIAPQLINTLSTTIHSEPTNALSIPTWIVHTSSLLEWLVAMKLIWEHSKTSDNPRWKGMTWAMIPSHASGLCACTYHFFYNSPVVISLVALQAALTTFGNSAMAFAAYRIYAYEKERSDDTIETLTTPEDKGNAVQTYAIAPEEREPLSESGIAFWLNMALKSTLLAIIVKYGELYLDEPFEPSIILALALISIPTMLNIGKWSYRSNTASETSVFTSS